MGLSRWLDQQAREALPPGSLVAPPEKLWALGDCAHCHRPIATHGYELMVETGDSDDPAAVEVDYHTAVLCEACYHRLVEKSFWIKSIEEISLAVMFIGMVLTILGFAVSRRPVVGIVGLAAMILPPLVRLPLRSIRQRMLQRAIARVFPQTENARFAAVRMPWLEKSVLFVVPMPLAVVVNNHLPLKDISSTDLKRILLGQINNWNQIGGPDQPINLYLPIGPWREWSFLQQTLLAGEKPGRHTVVDDPVALFDDLPRDVGGIGFVSLVLLESFGQAGRALTIDGQDCSTDNSAYPLWLMSGLPPAADA